MKKMLLFLLSALAVLPLTGLAAGTNGFIVFEISRNAYKPQPGSKTSNYMHQYKLALTDDFLRNFRCPSSPDSDGTQFYCGGGSLTNTLFSWCLEKTIDHRWRIQMYGLRFETIYGTNFYSMDPICTQSMVIDRLEDMDMSYQLSCVRGYDRLNFQFSTRYVTPHDINSYGAIPDAPVAKARYPFPFSDQFCCFWEPSWMVSRKL
jgi:hypothetical protein